MEKGVGQEHRLLDLYTRLQNGEVIRKADEASRFQVNKRTIQRDIDQIRAYLADQAAQGGECRELVYNRRKGGYVLFAEDNGLMDNSEILAVAKILLESRAFVGEEMDAILKKLLRGCVPTKEQTAVAELISNEALHYVPPRHGIQLTKRLWDLGQAVRQKMRIELDYCRMDGSLVKKRIVEPVAVLFSEYYFYLIAYNMATTPNGELVTEHDYPSYYRVDRIHAYIVQKDHFSIPYARRFEGGELRKRIQFMYGGSLRQVRFLYRGPSIEAIYDRLPTAEAVRAEDGTYLVTAEVFGEGIIQWLLSQGTYVEVLGPEDLRTEITERVRSMAAYYDR